MRLRFTTALGATSLSLAVVLTISGASVAWADDSLVSADDTWQMPGPFKGGSLAAAESALQPLVDAKLITVHPMNAKGPAQQILNPTNWIVCWQSPKAGTVVKVNPKKMKWVSIGLRRPDTKC